VVAAAWPNGTASLVTGSDLNRSTTPLVLSLAIATMDGSTFTPTVASRPGRRNCR